MVVGVGYENVEYNPFPEFKKVLFGRCSGRFDEGGDFGVSAVFVPVCVAEQGHSRREVDSPTGLSVKSFYEKSGTVSR